MQYRLLDTCSFSSLATAGLSLAHEVFLFCLFAVVLFFVWFLVFFLLFRGYYASKFDVVEQQKDGWN